LDSLRGGPVQGDVGGEPPVFEEATALEERAEVGVSGVHEFNEPLREGLRGVVFVGVVGQGGEGVRIDIFPDSHSSFCEGGVPRGDSDISCDRPTSPAGDDEVGESAIVLDEVAGSVVLAGDDGGRGSLLAESGDFLLKVADRVLIGGGPGDEGSGGGLCDVAKGFSAPSSPKGLEDSES